MRNIRPSNPKCKDKKINPKAILVKGFSDRQSAYIFHIKIVHFLKALDF